MKDQSISAFLIEGMNTGKNNEEVFAPINGFENYLISNKGIVKSLPKEHRTWEKFLKPHLTRQGYYRVDLCKDKQTFHRYIHIMVAEAFVDNPENKPTVNHEDGNKLNNNDWNLKWATRKEQQQHAIELGLFNPRGEGNGFSKFTSDQIMEIRRSSLKPVELAKKHNMSLTHVCDIINGKVWKHVL